MTGRGESSVLRRHSHELAILNDVARALNASVDLPAMLARALEKVAELLGLGTGWVLLFDEASGEPFLAAAQNLPPVLQEQPELMAGWCYCLEAFQEGNFDGAANVEVVSCSRLRKLALARTAGLRYHASVPLEGRTLPVALAALAAEAGSGGAPAVVFEAGAIVAALPPAVEVGLYRIAQEALQNALRHAEAGRVVLRLEVSPDEARLIVQDDGQGYETGNAGGDDAASRFGLVGMRERARLLGGGFRIETAPGEGTRVTAEIPLERP